MDGYTGLSAHKEQTYGRERDMDREQAVDREWTMEYEMEELVPVVGKLAQNYTAYESTSVSYEKAEQFMEAVLYCIRESGDGAYDLSPSGAKVSAQQAYEAGLIRVEKKVKAALALYNRMLPDFSSYGSSYLYDTFVMGIPEFFKWYDMKFAPQETILTLDYPLLKDLSGCTGIDRIYEFIRCICLEQKFLAVFQERDVINMLTAYNPMYQDTPDNICGPVYRSLIGHILSENSSVPQEKKETEDFIKKRTEAFLKARQSYDSALAEYLFAGI